MARRRDGQLNHIEPQRITTTVDGVTYEGTLYIYPAGPNLYQFSVSYGGDHRTITELMPSTYICEVHGRGELLSMVEAQKKDKRGTRGT